LEEFELKIQELRTAMRRKDDTDRLMKQDVDTYYKTLNAFTESVPHVINDKFIMMNEKVEVIRGKMQNHQIRLEEIQKKQINLQHLHD
jgi:hypothetical protein